MYTQYLLLQPLIYLTLMDLRHRAHGCLDVVLLGLGSIKQLDRVRPEGDE